MEAREFYNKKIKEDPTIGSVQLMEEYADYKLKLLDTPDITCSHEKTTKHIITGITYCANSKCRKLLNID